MAGLLDLFGQRDPNDPVNMGLLGMSAALGTPVRQGGGVGPAFGAFGQGFQNSQQAEMRRRLMESQIEENKRQSIPAPKARFIPLANGNIFDTETQSFKQAPQQEKPVKEPSSSPEMQLINALYPDPADPNRQKAIKDLLQKKSEFAPPANNFIYLPSADGTYTAASTRTAQTVPTGIKVPAGKLGTEKSPGQDAIDRKFSEEYVGWVVSGGFADVEKQINQLGSAANALESDKSLTGPVVGAFPDLVRSVTNPKAVDVKNTVQESVQRGLRATLGAQFTEKEGENFLKRAFNPSLGPEVNAARVRAMQTMLKTMAQSKNDAVKYFNENGTLKGFAGKSYTFKEFEDAVLSVGKGSSTNASSPKKRLKFDANGDPIQ